VLGYPEAGLMNKMLLTKPISIPWVLRTLCCEGIFQGTDFGDCSIKFILNQGFNLKK
jgi:hypothetical protein